ncbi:MAG: tetratricopeptide repeat protein [Anaerolineae bacterium]|nr:tetratricopeptide repeat protein [Anaerolineae bacterium]
MKLPKPIRAWLNPGPTHHPLPESDAVEQALEAGERAYAAEDYPRALDSFRAAMSQLHKSADAVASAQVIVRLVETLIALGKLDDAAQVIDRAYESTGETSQLTQRAYYECAQGQIARARGDTDLAQSRYEKAIKTGELARAGMGALGRAQGMLADLYLADGNASYAAHLFREALPRLGLTPDADLSSFFLGRFGEAQIINGQETEGQQMIERAARLARQMNLKAMERRWQITLGKRAAEQGRYNDAFTAFARAASLANFNQPTPELVDLHIQMSKTCRALGQLDEALDHANQAVNAAVSLKADALIAEARGTLGTALLATDQAAAALPHLQAAVDQPGTLTAERLDMHRQLAAAQVESGDVASAIHTYQTAAEAASAAGMKLETAQIQRDLGLLYFQRRRMTDAIQIWTQALAIYQQDKHTAQTIRLLCDLAAARRFIGQGTRALRDYQDASELLSRLNEDWETRGLVLANVAVAYVDSGDVETAEAFFNESIAIARRLEQPAAEAIRRGNHGFYLVQIGRAQQALPALEAALKMSRQLQLELPTAIQTDNIGLAYDSLARYSEAEREHRSALAQIEPLNEPHWKSLFQINLAQTLISMGQYDEVTALVEPAVALGRTEDNVEVVVRGLTALARADVLQGNPAAAIPRLEEAIHIARRGDLRRCLADALSVQSMAQAASGDSAAAESTWAEAQKHYRTLHHPLARGTPAWLAQPAGIKQG